MYKVHSQSTIEKAKYIFKNGLSCDFRLSKSDITKANKILVESTEEEFKTKIAELELELKKMRIKRKDVKNQIRLRHKDLMKRFGYGK